VPEQLYSARDLRICGRDLGPAAVVAVDLAAARARIPGFADLVIGADLMAGHAWTFDFTGRTWSLD
jgi:hypothetical protein